MIKKYAIWKTARGYEVICENESKNRYRPLTIFNTKKQAEKYRYDLLKEQDYILKEFKDELGTTWYVKATSDGTQKIVCPYEEELL